MGAGAVLRGLVGSGRCVVAPDVHDLMAAQLAEELDFEAVYVGSFGSAASRWGLPDQSVLTMSQLLDHFRLVTEAIDIPVIADFEDGGGNAVTCFRNVESAVRAGLAGIQIEDQLPGKGYGPVGHLHPIEVATEKIRAAVDARGDSDLVVIGRCEALNIGGTLEEVTERCAAYVEAGADLITPSGAPPEALAEIEQVAGAPVATWAFGTQSPEQLRDAGYTIAIYPMQSTLVSYAAIRSFLTGLRNDGVALGADEFLATMQQLMATNTGTANIELARKYGVID